MFARMSLTIDPAWPGVSPGTGWMLLAGAAALVVAITVWTYLGVRRSSSRRLFIVLGLRLLALAVTVLLMLRPSIAREEESAVDPSRLFILVDVSKSMSVADEFNNVTRLKRVQDLLANERIQGALRKLAEEKKVELVVFQGADEVKRYDPAAAPDGKSTDIGRWLDDLRREAGGDLPVQAMLIFSDGVDTGDPARTLQKAAAFRGKWPLMTFGVGQSTTTGQDKDIFVDQILVEPQPILAKGKMKVKAIIQAPGFENAQTEVSLWIEDRAAKKMVKVLSRPERLTQAADNVVTFETDAPDTQGEIKITVKAAKLAGETSELNNEISTFAYVSKDGVRILWVEGKKRAFEGVFAIRHALAKDRRFQVVYVERGKAASPEKLDVDPYRFDQVAYDVLVIGDISAARFGDFGVMTKVRDRVQNHGMGLVMLGGYETFGNSDWQGSLVADLFPVRFDRAGQIEGKVRVAPTPEGFQYLFKLADDAKSNQQIWDKVMAPLEGMTQPGTRDPRSTVFAMQDGTDNAVLAGIVRGKGRVLAFPVDTTWQSWRRTPEAVAAYERFWRQMMLWLAQQENSQGSVFVELDQRRIERPRPIGFRVGFRGVEIPNPKFTAKIVGPRGEEYPIPIGADPRGSWTPPTAGEYTFHVEGKGTTPLGKPTEGRDVARFVVTETDRELLRPAADHDFLEKLAAAADGAFARADERTFLHLLDELQARQTPVETKISHWPDWRRNPPSDSIGDQFSTLWRSTVLVALVVYIGCLCTEWYLRRRWGMV
jgi:uncharacterized membrane protein